MIDRVDRLRVNRERVLDGAHYSRISWYARPEEKLEERRRKRRRSPSKVESSRLDERRENGKTVRTMRAKVDGKNGFLLFSDPLPNAGRLTASLGCIHRRTFQRATYEGDGGLLSTLDNLENGNEPKEPRPVPSRPANRCDRGIWNNFQSRRSGTT